MADVKLAASILPKFCGTSILQIILIPLVETIADFEKRLLESLICSWLTALNVADSAESGYQIDRRTVRSVPGGLYVLLCGSLYT